MEGFWGGCRNDGGEAEGYAGRMEVLGVGCGGFEGLWEDGGGRGRMQGCAQGDAECLGGIGRDGGRTGEWGCSRGCAGMRGGWETGGWDGGGMRRWLQPAPLAY